MHSPLPPKPVEAAPFPPFVGLLQAEKGKENKNEPRTCFGNRFRPSNGTNCWREEGPSAAQRRLFSYNGEQPHASVLQDVGDDPRHACWARHRPAAPSAAEIMAAQ
jgi:hypothetical protein